MATPEDCRVVRDAVRGLCSPLRRSVERSWELADQVFVEFGMSEEEHRGGRAHLARHFLRRELRNADDLGGWKLARHRASNGEVKLLRETMSLKVLRPGPMGAVPAPGPNLARMSYYQNPKLNLFGAEGSNLIAIWTVNVKTGEPEIRLVRTISGWKSLKSEQVDIDFFLPKTAEELDDMAFVPSDDGLGLPFFLEDDLGEDEADGGPADW